MGSIVRYQEVNRLCYSQEMMNVSSSLSSGPIPYFQENRLYERFDGTIGVAEKPLGYVIGERVLAPMIDVVSSVSRSFFRMMLSMTHSLGSALSEVHHFQFFRGVAAADIPLCAQEDLTRNEKKRLREDTCCDLSKQEYKTIKSFLGPGLIYTRDLINYITRPFSTSPGRRQEISALLKAFEGADHEQLILSTFAWESSSMEWYRSQVKSKMDTALYTDFLRNLEQLYQTHLDIFGLVRMDDSNDNINFLNFQFSYYEICNRYLFLIEKIARDLLTYSKASAMVLSGSKDTDLKPINSEVLKRYFSLEFKDRFKSFDEAMKAFSSQMNDFLFFVSQNADKYQAQKVDYRLLPSAVTHHTNVGGGTNKKIRVEVIKLDSQEMKDALTQNRKAEENLRLFSSTIVHGANIKAVVDCIQLSAKGIERSLEDIVGDREGEVRSLVYDRMLSVHAMWMQLKKQSVAIRSIQNDVIMIRELIIKDLMSKQNLICYLDIRGRVALNNAVEAEECENDEAVLERISSTFKSKEDIKQGYLVDRIPSAVDLYLDSLLHKSCCIKRIGDYA